MAREMEIVVGNCYLVSLLEPFKDINEINPSKVTVALSEGWGMTPATTAFKKIQNKRTHPAIVLRYNNSTKNAVILVGSTHPQQAHRFVPCFGTQRLDFQTVEMLRPNPLEALSAWQGHFNFSHAIHVRVLQPHEYEVPAFLNFPGLGVSQEGKDDEGELKIMFDEVQLTLLKELHIAYWNGKRHSKDGKLLLSSAFGSPPSSPSSQQPGGLSPSSQQPGGSSTDPILGSSGLKFSTRMANLLEREDERGLQLELLDEDEDISAISAPSLGLFQPCTHSFFQEPGNDPMPGKFAYECNHFSS